MTQERHQAYADYFDNCEEKFESLPSRFQKSIQSIITVVQKIKPCDCPTIVAIKSCRVTCDIQSRFKR